MIFIIPSIFLSAIYLIFYFPDIKHGKGHKYIKYICANILLVASIFFNTVSPISYLDIIFLIVLFGVESISEIISKKKVSLIVEVIIKVAITTGLFFLIKYVNLNIILVVSLMLTILSAIISSYKNEKKYINDLIKYCKPLDDLIEYNPKVKSIIQEFASLKYKLFYLEMDTINSQIFKHDGDYKIIITSSLISKFDTAEITSIIYHEIGHCKMNHANTLSILKLVNNVLLIMVSYLIFKICIFSDYNYVSGFILLYIIIDGYLSIFKYINTRILWKQEYSADSYSTAKFSSDALVGALYKLDLYYPYQKSLSHPSYKNRIDKIKKRI